MGRHGPHRRGDIPVNRIPQNLDEMGRITPVESVGVYAWCPERDGKGKPTQVHVMIKTAGRSFALRLKSAEAVDELIDHLANMRNIVWPEST